MQNLSRRKSVRLTKLDKQLQAVEHEGSPSSKHASHSRGDHATAEGSRSTKMRLEQGKGTHETPVVSLERVILNRIRH
jgi:hypothetical protein